MYNTTPLAGPSARDEHARAFVARWSTTAGGELGNFQMFYTELTDALGLPRPEPNASGTGDYVFERVVTFADGRRGRADLFKAGCCVIEAKGFGRVPSSDRKQVGEKGRRRAAVRRGTPAWERAMRAAARQGARYARALAPHGLAPPFVVALDVGFAFDLYHDPSGTGRSYVRYPAARRIRVADLVREEVRDVLRLVLTEPQDLNLSHTQRTGEQVQVGRRALQNQCPAARDLVGAIGLVREAERLAWPTRLADQACAVRRVVRDEGMPVTADYVAGTFAEAHLVAVTAVLDALAALGLVRIAGGGLYFA